MTAPAALYVLRWLVRDTFRQAMASGIFWLMLAVSAVCIAFCLTVQVVGDRDLREGERIDALPRFFPSEYAAGVADLVAVGASHSRGVLQAPRAVRKEYQQAANAIEDGTVPVVAGHLSLAFGAVQAPIARDRVETVQTLQLHLAGWVADAAGLLLALLWTAGFLPTFLESSAVAVLLAKPAPRWLLFAGKCLGVLAFVAFQALVFVGGTWLALALRTGVWDPRYFLCLPVLLVHFAVFFSFSALLAVTTRSTVVCVFGSILFWFLCWGMNYGRHMALLTPELANLRETAPFFAWTIEAGYWLLPKPLDFHLVLVDLMQAEDFFASAVNVRGLVEQNAWDPGGSVAASVLAGLTLFALAIYEFIAAEY